MVIDMRLVDIDDDRNCFCGYDGEYEKWNIDPDVMKEAQPTIEPERKKGKWIMWFKPGREHCECSECKTEWYEEDLYMGGNDFPKYCPECGAPMKNWKIPDMRGEQE